MSPWSKHRIEMKVHINIVGSLNAECYYLGGWTLKIIFDALFSQSFPINMESTHSNNLP